MSSLLFRARPSPLGDASVRARLQRAILDNDAGTFRGILQQALPAIAAQHWLFGVLIMTPEGMKPIMVDENGHRIGPGFVIDRGTPIDLLNVEYGPTEMTVTTPEGEVWKAPYKPTG